MSSSFVAESPSSCFAPCRPLDDVNHNSADHIVRTIFEGTAAATYDAFFSALVCNLAIALGVGYAFVVAITANLTF